MKYKLLSNVALAVLLLIELWLLWPFLKNFYESGGLRLIFFTLLPSTLIVVIYLSHRKKQSHSDKGLEILFSAASIFITLIIFFVTGIQRDFELQKSIEVINYYNCKFANSLDAEIGKVFAGERKYPIHKGFITDIYIDNIAFIYRKYGSTTLDTYNQGLIDLDFANGLLTKTEEISTNDPNFENTIVGLYKDLEDKALDRILNDFCPNVVQISV